ncbi:hypothetical protein OAB79_00530 [Yoonia sp.]|nr:hypothetical protein [Yoonia sp.]
MGRKGNYLGGGTVIGPGSDWFAKDSEKTEKLHAQGQREGEIARARLLNKELSRKRDLLIELKKQSPHTAKKAKTKNASSKVKKPKNPSKLLESARKSLLELIIDQILKHGGPEIKFPGQMHPDLNTAVARFKNPVEWATQQSDFEQIQTKKIQLKTERELRRRARKQMQDAVVVLIKRAKTIHKPGGTDSGNLSVGSASASTSAIKMGALPLQKKKSQTAKLGPAGSHENRTLFIRLLVDRLIQKKASETTPPTTDPVLLAEISEAGGNIAWLKLQPSYHDVFAVRSAVLKPAQKLFKSTFQVEASTKLSEEQAIRLGRSRIVALGKMRSSPDMDALIKRVGILPPRPVKQIKNVTNIKRAISKKQKFWVSRLAPPQKDAWAKLLSKHQQEYWSFGKIILGTPDEPKKPQKLKVTPLSNAPVSYIIAQVEKKSDDVLDPKRIDWGST